MKTFRLLVLFPLFITLIITTSGLAKSSLEVNIPDSYSLMDQFGSKHNLTHGTRGVILAHTFSEAKAISKYLDDLHPTFLKEQKIYVIVDLSQANSFMKQWYYLPKLRRFNHVVLIGQNDTFMDSIPRQSKKLTFIEINDDQSIKTISFLSTISEIYSHITALNTSIQIGERMYRYKLTDQFGKFHQLSDDKQTLIVANEMQVAKNVNTWLSTKSPSFLDDHRAAYIAEISGMPKAITKMFALPKMRKYHFPILLAHDKELEGKGIQKIGAVTILELDQDQVITGISHASIPTEFEEFFKKPELKQ